MELVDTVPIVSDEKKGDPVPRGHTIPIYGPEYEWWTDAVKRQLAARSMDQQELAKHLDVDTGTLSRCIRRKKPTYELLIAISDFLVVAYPVLLPESEAEALELAKEKRKFKRDAEVARIKAGVPEIAKKDQGVSVVSEHAVRSPKKKDTKAPRRRQQPRHD